MTSFHGHSLFMFSVAFFAALTFGQANPFAELSTRSELVEQAGYGEEKLSSVLVTGTVLCKPSLHGEGKQRMQSVSGALVAISCKTARRKEKLINWAQETTDDYGEFFINLPSQLHAIPNLDKACTVRVLRLPRKSPCRKVSTRIPNRMTLSSFGNSIRTYTVGNIRLEQPLKLRA